MRGKRIANDVRAQVIAALLEGQGVTQIAAKYRLAQSTVSGLRKEIPAEKLDEVRSKKRDDLAQLIASNLEAAFAALTNILNITRDPNWLKKQSAAELATMYGVISDKNFRILEAIDNAANVDRNQNEE
jgi:hypothetical protein